MASAIFGPYLAPDDVVYGDASGTALTITKGDFVAASGSWIIAANSGIAYYKVSGVGIALENNPWYDELGVPRVNTALAIMRAGIARVSAMSASAVGTDAPVMQPVFPSTTGSGIVGQTGATGMTVVWVTGAPVRISSNPTGALASGVAKILKVITYGSTGQWDVLLTLQDNGYF